MRNYFKALGLPRLTKSSDIRRTIESSDPDQLAQEDDLQSILMNDKWCSHYRRAHLQYEAIAAAINHPSLRDINNTHNWDKRVVEFYPDQDTIDMQQTDTGF